MSTPDETMKMPDESGENNETAETIQTDADGGETIQTNVDDSTAETIVSDAVNPSAVETQTFVQPEADSEAAQTVRTDGAPESVDQRATQSYDQPKQEQAESDPLVGVMLDNYEVVGKLGKGGFGAVYKGRDVNLDRFAAIKFLHLALEGEYKELFRREAKILANLSKHPCIVQIYNWGELGEQNYMALELLDASVQDLIEKKPEGLPTQEALTIALAGAEALEYAHGEGVLHRDIKPANMLIERKTNQTKICDFGLAKYYSKGNESASGVIAGSPPYMPVEQIKGDVVDERADVYALGVTLYEMLSGRLPFEGKTQLEVMDNVKSRRGTPLPKRRPDLSKGVLAIVEKATASKKEDRFQSAGEFKEALQYALDSLERTGSVDTVPFKVKSQTNPLVAVAGFAAIVLVLMAGIRLMNPVPPGGGTYANVPAGLVEAHQLMEIGDYQGAAFAYQTYLESQPESENAHYGLAYANIHSGNWDGARKSASILGDLGMKSEIEAAIAHATEGEQARSIIESAAESVPTGYPVVLLANLDLSGEDHDAVIERLASFDGSSLRFGWQRDRANQTLAQAYFNTGNFDKATVAFQSLAASERAGSKRIAEAYLELARKQVDTERSEVISQKAARVREMLEAQESGESVEFDTWTSRPLRLWIVEPRVQSGSQVPVQEGLTGVFTSWLGENLIETDGIPLEVVERELIAEILQEQELSGLSNDNDRVRLGQVLGARLILVPEFKYFQGDQLKVKVIDTETTKFIPVKTIDVPSTKDGDIDWDTWMLSVSDLVREKIEGGYPRRGQMAAGPDGLALNIGSGVGVEEGMTFKVFSTADHANELDGKTVTVTGGIGSDSARVSAEGFSAESVPADGWYVEEIKAAESA